MLSIIIINDCDSTKYVERTVLSIEEYVTNINCEIIIVNLKIPAEDESRKKLKVYYLPTDNFAKAKNFGVSKSSYKHLFFLKAGVIIKVNPFLHLFEKFKNRNYGAIAFKLYDFRENFKINFWRDISFTEEIEEESVNKKLLKGNTHKALGFENNAHDIISVGRVSGDAMLVDKEVFSSVGGFNEYLIQYYEDADLCNRFLQKKFANYFYPFCKLVDLRLDETDITIRIKSRFRYYKLHSSISVRFFMRVYLLLKYSVLLLTFSKQNFKAFKSVLNPY